MDQQEFNSLIEKIKKNEIVELKFFPPALVLAEIKVIAEALKDNTSLLNIDFGENQIGDAGAVVLAEMLKTNRSLHQINLTGNKIGVAGAAALAEMLQINGSLHQLNLGWNRLGDTGVALLAQALKANGSVHAINLRQNRLGVIGATALAEMLQTNRTVRTIALHNNQIGDAGAEVLALALKANGSVHTIKLAGNQIGSAGGVALAAALQTNGSVQTIDLADNKIGTDGALAFAAALQTNGSVHTIALYNNHIGDAGVIALAEMLKTNCTVSMIDLEGSPIGEACAAEIDAELKANSFLSSLPDFDQGPSHPLEHRMRCSALKGIFLQMIAVYPDLQFVPEKISKSLVALLEQMNLMYEACIVQISEDTVFEQGRQSVNEIVKLLEYAPEKNKKLIEFCIQKLTLNSSDVRQTFIYHKPLLAAAKELAILQPHNESLHAFIGSLTKQIVDIEEALRATVDMFQCQLKPGQRLLPLEHCIQQLRGKELEPRYSLTILSYRLLLEATTKVQATLPPALQKFVATLLQRQDYHPETAGMFMAIPEVMAYLGMAPAFASLDSDDTKPVLIDCYVRQDSQPVVLQAAIITEASVTPDFRGSLENYGMFHPLEDSSVPCEIFVRGGDVKPK